MRRSVRGQEVERGGHVGIIEGNPPLGTEEFGKAARLSGPPPNRKEGFRQTQELKGIFPQSYPLHTMECRFIIYLSNVYPFRPWSAFPSRPPLKQYSHFTADVKPSDQTRGGGTRGAECADSGHRNVLWADEGFVSAASR